MNELIEKLQCTKEDLTVKNSISLTRKIKKDFKIDKFLIQTRGVLLGSEDLGIDYMECNLVFKIFMKRKMEDGNTSISCCIAAYTLFKGRQSIICCL